MALLPTNGLNSGSSTQLSVGVQAKSPSTGLVAPKTTLPTNQIAPRDLSGTYANVGGTIYNKSSQSKFSNEADFYKDSGLTSFNNVKFDNAYTPTGKETIYGQPQVQTPPPVAPPANTPAVTPPAPTGAYTPPNQGTTGVSQGGIIGNLINKSNGPSQEYLDAQAEAKRVSDEQTALAKDFAEKNTNIQGTAGFLTQAGGLQGLLQQQYNTGAAALSSQYAGATNRLNAANTQQGLQVQAGQGAGSLNAPITGVPYGTQTIQPSQPNGNTTSGAANLSSLIGTRNDANGKPNGEFYNTQTDQGFKDPQALADFVNKQLPGTNANAQNVFQLLDQLKANGGGNASGGALNPLNNLASIAADVISGRRSLRDAEGMGGSVAGWTGILNQELQKQSGGAFDGSAAQARYDANQAVQGNQAQQKAQYQSSAQQASNLGKQLNSLLTAYGLNPSDLNLANAFSQLIGRNTSDPRYAVFNNLITDLVNTYTGILGAGGNTTDLVRNLSASLLDSNYKGPAIKQILDTLDQQVQAKIAGIQTPSTTTQGGGSLDPLGLGI